MNRPKTKIDCLNEAIVRLICTTLAGFGVHNAEQDILLPWLMKHPEKPKVANIEVIGKVFKHQHCKDAVLKVLDDVLIEAGAVSADETLVGV